MKYLKFFEGFKSSDTISEDIKDIFLELVDKGFHVRVSDDDDPGFITIYHGSWRPKYNVYHLSLQFRPHPRDSDRNDLGWEIDSDVIGCILRLIDYLRMSKLYLNSIYIDYTKPGQFSEHKLVTKVTEEGLFISEITTLGGIKVDWMIDKMKLKYSKSNI